MVVRSFLAKPCFFTNALCGWVAFLSCLLKPVMAFYLEARLALYGCKPKWLLQADGEHSPPFLLAWAIRLLGSLWLVCHMVSTFLSNTQAQHGIG